ncbi:MAG: methyltransferase domain-containing protein [Marmoricola sp.]
MAVHRWTRDASRADLKLFVGQCQGPTLDVGCGPGRLTAAVTGRGFYALGIDISAEAVLQTRARGGAAVCHDVFVELSGATTWQHVLLADGNIGLGGDPVRLLRRVAELLASHGSALVEVAGHGVGTVHEQVRLRVGDQMSTPFTWATVGIDSIDAVAGQAGLLLERLRHDSGRYVATLRHARTRH